MMAELIFIKHESLHSDLLDVICDIKASAWDYSIEEHKKWVEKNINPNDIHVLLKENDTYVGYLNLIQTHVLSSDKKIILVLGIGNVCAKIKGKGYGSTLMKLLNNHLSLENTKAILLCKVDLVDFYSKLGYTFNFKVKDNIYLMSINLDDSNFFTFIGDLF